MRFVSSEEQPTTRQPDHTENYSITQSFSPPQALDAPAYSRINDLPFRVLSLCRLDFSWAHKRRFLLMLGLKIPESGRDSFDAWTEKPEALASACMPLDQFIGA